MMIWDRLGTDSSYEVVLVQTELLPESSFNESCYNPGTAAKPVMNKVCGLRLVERLHLSSRKWMVQIEKSMTRSAQAAG